jgi:DNA-binding transcriptional regulator YhcF (GntR family)
MDDSLDLLRTGYSKATDFVADLVEMGYSAEEIVEILKNCANYKK